MAAGKEKESLRLKTLAEQKYASGNLLSAVKHAKRAHRLNPSLDGLSEMLTAFKILHTAAKPASASASDDSNSTTLSPNPTPPDYYKILQVERFSHINTIKKQYKKLALSLHPDKNPLAASEEAFKLVGEAFRVLSDKIRRKEYDMKLRIAMQSAVSEAAAEGSEETFWTACSTCRLLHQFERKYLGRELMCPNCKKSFKAVEVSENVKDSEERVGTRASARIRAKKDAELDDFVLGDLKVKRKTSSIRKVLKRPGEKALKNVGGSGGLELKEVKQAINVGEKEETERPGGGVIEGLRSRGVKRMRSKGEEMEVRSGGEVVERSRGKKIKDGDEETMTLAEMQMLVRKKVNKEKMNMKETEGQKEKKDNESNKVENEKLITIASQKGNNKEKSNLKEKEGKEKDTEKLMEIMSVKGKEKRERQGNSKYESLEIVGSKSSKSGNLEYRRRKVSTLDITAVEDKCLYDFDKDRTERSFKKGQIWALRDDGDGMPRHYCLIDEVVSMNPFEVRCGLLDFQGDQSLICREKMGFHITCGRFKVSWKTTIKSLKKFSHIVDCERAARLLYRIYPKKGSVWAIYENALDAEASWQMDKEGRCYAIVVFLTNYSEIHGLSMAYLEKVDGFRTVFKRKEIGAHAIRWLQKDDLGLFSHQVPSRKLSVEEALSLPKDCWELDPASLPPKLLTIGWGR